MKIEHIAIWSKNIDRLKDFYVSFFGGKPGNRYLNPAKSFESYFITFDSGARLELMQMPGIHGNSNTPEAQSLGFIHLAFSVGSREEVNRLTDLLKSKGYTLLSEPRNTGDGYYESCVLDPDGNRIEITV